MVWVRRLIAVVPHGRYDRHNCNTVDLIGAPVDDKAELERRLGAGEWLSTGEVARLLETSRYTVIRIVNDGRVIDGQRYEIGTRGLGRHRELDPADVQRLLDARRRRRSSTDAG
jgi:hypothetical protein